MIRGALLLGTPTGMRIVPEKGLPEIEDGGCSFIYLLYNADTGKMVWIRCNGLA
jgi:hypothetical protein